MMFKFEYLTDPIEIKIGLQYLLIENKPLYRRVTEAFHAGTADELFVLSENYAPLDMNKALCYIRDIFDLSYSDRKLNNKLSSELEQTANDILFSDVLSVTEKLNNIGERLSYEFDFDVSYNDALSTDDIIKLLSFKPRLDADSVLENTVRFMKICRKYLGIKLFVVSGLCCCFTKEELSDLHRELSAGDICALDIESIVLNDVKPDRIYIVDKDLCEVIDK